MEKDFDKLMEKYAAKKKERYMSEKVKHGLAGAAAGLIGIPVVNPLDVLEVRAKAGIKDTFKSKKPPESKMKFRKRPYKLKALKAGRFIKKYWAGSGYRALKTIPSMAIGFGLQPTFKKMLDKRYKTPK